MSPAFQAACAPLSGRVVQMSLALVAATVCALSACGDDDVVVVPLRIGGLASCPIAAEGTSPLGISLTAYGDFPLPVVHSWDRDRDGASRLDFPGETRAFRAQLPGLASFVGMAESEVDPQSAFDIVLLPESSRPCGLVSPEDGPPAAPTVAARPDGSFVMAGGEVAGLGDARAYVWSPSTRSFTTLDGLASRRLLGATVTTASGAVVITGGAPARDAGAHATAEVLAPGEMAFDRDAIVLGEPRCDHAAAALADDSVLLLGGRASPTGPPVRTAEILDLVTRRTRADFAPMIVARAGHDAAVLDDGSVLIAGGLDADDQPVVLVERYQPSSRTFVAEESFAPEHACPAGWSIVPLVGGRALLVARCRATPRYVLLRVGGLVRLDVDIEVFPGVVDAAAVRTDGRVLSVGRLPAPDEDGNLAWVRHVVDDLTPLVPPYVGDVADEPVDPDPPEARRLLALASGDLVDVAWRADGSGRPTERASTVRLRSGIALSSFATPSGTALVSNSEQFALDAATVAPGGEFAFRWDFTSGIVPHERGSEAWLVRARFRRLSATVEHRVVDGDPVDVSAVLLSRLPAPLSRTGAPLRIEWTDARLVIRAEPECAIDAPVSPGTEHRVVTVERIASDRVRASIADVGADGAELATRSTSSCLVTELEPRVHVGLSPARRHRLSDFSIRRDP